MNDNQKIAIDNNIKCLTDTLGLEYIIFAANLEMNGVINGAEIQLNQVEYKTDEYRIYNLLQLIKGKLGSWDILLQYLNDHRHADLADSLRKSAGVESVGDKSVLSRFSSALAKFYKSPQSANIPSLWGDPKSVRDFWVPLRAEEKTKVFAKGERLDHAELQKCLADREDSDVALVIGDPGMGKTTLVKKITYDWAVNYESNPDENQFKLVLSVPLRSVGKFDDFYDIVELAIDYFLETLKLGRKLRFSPTDKSNLIQLVTDLDSKLLIILDGLDEYNNYDESLFKSFFAPKFSHSHHTSAKSDQPAVIDYKLIITSRPYACEQINVEFLPALKFQLCLLDKENLEKFVEIYCQTDSGKVAVNQYVNRHSVIKVPLILTFICYLADSSKTEIPANLTLLYDNLIRQMLRREGKEEKLEEMISSLGQLAYVGYKNGKYEFSVEFLEEFHVSNDSFICGFLLEKFDFADNRRKVEFRHRSVQEFFAALYAYKMFLENNRKEREIIRELICANFDQQFDRFFFGICSNQNTFVDMIDWISANFYDMLLNRRFHLFASDMLADCTIDEQFLFGRNLYRTLANFSEVLIAKWNRSSFAGNFRASPTFASGLNLKQICPESTSEWYEDYYMCDVEQPRIARLASVHRHSPKELGGRFDLIDILIWSPFKLPLSDEFWGRLIATTFAIPVRTAVIQEYFGAIFNVTLLLKYGNGVDPLQLKVLRFGFDYDPLRNNLKIVSSFDSNCIEISERESDTVGPNHFRRLTVTVIRTVSQTTLIRSLIKHSLNEFSPDVKQKCKCKTNYFISGL